MYPISICIIAKNEEKNLENFLKRIVDFTKGFPVEILLVDTGSTDRTKDIATSYVNTLLHFDWIGDFSAARNFSIKQAKYDWILVLDCDEYIEEMDMNYIQELMKTYPQYIGQLFRNNHYSMKDVDYVYTDMVPRLFSRKLYHYEGTIHEQVKPLVWADKLTCFDLPLTVDHLGYVGTKEELEAKAKRNNDLLFKELEKTPNDPYLYFQIGQSYNMIHDYANAATYYQKGLDQNPNPSLEYSIMMAEAYGNALLSSGQYEAAENLLQIYDQYCNDAGFLCMMGRMYLYNNLPLKALGEYVKATMIPTSRVDGSNSFLPRYYIGYINELLGEKEGALKLYRSCGDYQPALDKIAELTSHCK